VRLALGRLLGLRRSQNWRNRGSLPNQPEGNLGAPVLVDGVRSVSIVHHRRPPGDGLG